MTYRLWNKFKNYLIAGLIAILPLWISYYILYAIFNVATSLAKPFFRYVPGLSATPFLLNLVSFLGTILFVMGLGIILTNVVGRRLFLTLERYVARLPVLSWIYSAIRKLTALFYQEDGEKRFKRVVMLEYPRKGIYVIGFSTTDVVEELNAKANKTMVNVFLPTTPNPTSGFLLMVPREDVTPLDISMEDAVKLIVSGGVVAPGSIL